MLTAMVTIAAEEKRQSARPGTAGPRLGHVGVRHRPRRSSGGRSLPAMNKPLDERARRHRGRHQARRRGAGQGRGRARGVHRQARRGAQGGRRRSATAPAPTARRSSPRRKETAQAEAARVTANAHAQIEAERQSALVSLRSEVGTLALDLAGGVIGESLSEDTRAQSVVDRFLAELEESEKAASAGTGTEGVMGSATTQALVGDDGGAQRRRRRRPRHRPRAVRRGAGRRRLVAPERRARRFRRAPASPHPVGRGRLRRPVLEATTVSLLTTVVAQRWSRAADLVDAIEELAVRAAAIAEPGADVEGELFARLADRRRRPAARARARQPPRRRRRQGRARREALRRPGERRDGAHRVVARAAAPRAPRAPAARVARCRLVDRPARTAWSPRSSRQRRSAPRRPSA